MAVTALLIAAAVTVPAVVALVVVGARRTPSRGMPTEGGTW